MGKCKDCEFWKLIPPAGSCFQAGECSRLVLVSKKDDDRQLCTESTFSCAYFKEKQHGPFIVTSCHSAGFDTGRERLAFNGDIGPGIPDNLGSWLYVLRDWLNGLWARRDQEKECSTCRYWCSARLWCDKSGYGANLNDSCRFWKGKGK